MRLFCLGKGAFFGKTKNNLNKTESLFVIKGEMF